jgi:hypothetical protein
VPVRKRAILGVLELRLERERPGVALPADERRLELVDRSAAAIRARAAAQPLIEPRSRRRPRLLDLDRDRAGRLVRVEQNVRPDLLGTALDRLDPNGGLEEHVVERDEQRALVDRLQQGVQAGTTSTSRPPGLEQKRTTGTRPRGRRSCCGAAPAGSTRDDRDRDGHVLVHAGRARARADDTADLVADRWHVHQPSPQERIPRVFHIRAYSTRRSSAAAGIAASEWLIR